LSDEQANLVEGAPEEPADRSPSTPTPAAEATSIPTTATTTSTTSASASATGSPEPPRPPRWRRHVFGAALAVAYLATLLATAGDIGMGRDESFYYEAADRYQQWFDLLLKSPKEAMKRQAIEDHWSPNHEHPPLAKVAFGMSHRLFNQKLGWLRPSTSYRLPAMLCGALLLYLLFLFTAKRLGELEAFLAAGFLALMPGFFYHAHLNALDVPITLLVFATLYAFEKSCRSNWWALLCGVFFGLGLLTKLNAFFVPPTLFVIWVLRDVMRPTPAAAFAALSLVIGLVFQLDTRLLVVFGVLLAVAVVRASDRRGGHLTFPRIPTAFFWMVLLGPLLLWAGWPWMWHHTLDHFRDYVNFHAKHDFYNIAYFGRNYFRPPFPVSYPFVMTALTTPVITLLASAIGMALFLRYRAKAMHRAERAAVLFQAPPRSRDFLHRLVLRPWRAARPGPEDDDEIARAQRLSPGIGMFLAVNLLVPILIIAHPQVFIFGGTKHWMPAWPFLAIFAGVGAAWGLRRLAAAIPERLSRVRLGRRTVPLRPLAVGVLCLLCLSPAAQGTAQSHPFGLSHYNLLAGGVPGSADLGMCRQFWGFTTGSLLPWLDANVSRNGTVFFHDTTRQSFAMFQADGLLRPDIRWSDVLEGTNVALFHHELHAAVVEHAIWQAYGTAAPTYALTHEGVAIISVYVRPGTRLGYP
jgi:4-amino-4-deoxy-L-arabinose transferase-like glycosyltransferase